MQILRGGGQGMTEKIQDFIWNGFALHQKHKLYIFFENKFTLSGKISFRVFREQKMDLFKFINAVIEGCF